MLIIKPSFVRRHLKVTSDRTNLRYSITCSVDCQDPVFWGSYIIYRVEVDSLTANFVEIFTCESHPIETYDASDAIREVCKEAISTLSQYDNNL